MNTDPLQEAIPAAGFPEVPGALGLLVALSLIPVILAMATSFTKIVVVGGLLRQALATNNLPPTLVITGLAVLLTTHIMAPVALEAWNEVQKLPEAARTEPAPVAAAVSRAVRPWLERNASPEHIELFQGLRARGATTDAILAGLPPDARDTAVALQEPIETLTVLAPAFLLTELVEALMIGFLLFLPFLVLDFVVTTVLIALGMQNLMPTTVSLPIKILLFVLADGWTLVITGLVGSYR